MAADQESVTRILQALSNPTRREILLNLNEKSECSFTDLMNALGIDTGKLSFHIRNLTGLIEQSPSGKYQLSKMGEKAVRLVMDLQSWASELSILDRDASIPVARTRKRAYAFLIDFGVVLAVFAVASLMATVFSLITGGGFRPDINVTFFVLVFWIYSTLLEGFGGQSLGKRLLGLTVVRLDGKRMYYDHAAVRNFGKIFVILPFDLLVGRQLKDKRYIRYFDKFAGTTVIDLKPEHSEESPTRAEPS